MKRRTILVTIGLLCICLTRGFTPPRHISITSPAINGFVSIIKSVAISAPMMRSHDVPLIFKVITRAQDHDERYHETLVLKIMPPSLRTDGDEIKKEECAAFFRRGN